MKTKQVEICGPMDECCLVCGRVAWGQWQSVGFRHWRHDECGPGSKNWFVKMATIKRTPIQDEIYHYWRRCRDEEQRQKALATLRRA